MSQAVTYIEGELRHEGCETVTVRIPTLPDFIDANTATGEFPVERDRYIDG